MVFWRNHAFVPAACLGAVDGNLCLVSVVRGMMDATWLCLHVKGLNMCLGYWRNEKVMKETFEHEGNLKTDEVAARNRNRICWIVDRKMELIKVKSFEVVSNELEALLWEHEYVADTAVFSIQFEHEEHPRAYDSTNDEQKQQAKEEVNRKMGSKMYCKAQTTYWWCSAS
ncbi:hypothetical protein B0J11DRAFT_169942 [Dendryphion nanum]|uniref:Uncharacterized protein n=1 Tax=Dendryphion nanum TaxID=256645 RepID=A0A9P9EE55_9PLEO|nr:hypothetical protein B0J11DRAFT_169942 [Dendryphion nanum]